MPPVLYYIRHGETDWNADHRLQGQSDAPLNAAGRAQMRRCGEILRGVLAREGRAPADLDYLSSPLGRARSSMELMRAALGLDPAGYRIEPRLIEMSFGRWEGLTFADLMAQVPDALAARQRDPWHFAPPGGESYEQLLARMQDWHRSLTRDAVVCAHLCTARALLVHLGLAPPDAAPSSRFEHAALYVFDGTGMARRGEAQSI
jgi:broad specificity phosphatase PhoE